MGKNYTEDTKSETTNNSDVSDNRAGYKKKRNRNRNYSQGKSKSMESTTNDYSWYSKYPELIVGAANIDYSLAQGIPIEAFGNRTLPGFMKFDIIPGIPITDSPSDPINISGTNTFLYINKGKNNNRPYDPVDLTKLEIATAHVFSYVNWLQRIYGLACLYSTKNRYLPEMLVNAMGVNFNNVVRNMANFRSGINQFIRKIAALVLPSADKVPYYARTAFLFRNIYQESPTIKDQIYFMNPVGFLKYDTTKAGLVFEKLNPDNKKLGVIDLLDYADGLVDSFFGDTDIATMCADILNTYGDNVIKLQILPEEAIVVPVYDTVVLEQLWNTRIMPVNDVSVSIRGEASENPYIVYRPTGWYDTLPSSDHAGKVAQILNRPQLVLTNIPGGSIQATVENTRLKPRVLAEDQDTVVTVDYRTSSSELCTKCSVYAINEDKCYPWSFETINLVDLEDSTNVSDALYLEYLLSKFQYAPHRNYMIYDSSKEEMMLTESGSIGSVTEYAHVPDSTLDNLHRICAFSLFALPMSTI